MLLTFVLRLIPLVGIISYYTHTDWLFYIASIFASVMSIAFIFLWQMPHNKRSFILFSWIAICVIFVRRFDSFITAILLANCYHVVLCNAITWIFRIIVALTALIISAFKKVK